jgi:hypothetical protein
VIISNIEYREDNGVVSVVARITADKGRFSRDVYVQSDNGNLLSAEPSAFLLAAYLPAWAMGEREIIVEGDICPVLLANFKVSASILRHWFSDFGVAPHVTSGVARRVPADGAAVFMSAGVDSMHTLFELTEHLLLGIPTVRREESCWIIGACHWGMMRLFGGLTRGESGANFYLVAEDLNLTGYEQIFGA